MQRSRDSHGFSVMAGEQDSLVARGDSWSMFQPGVSVLVGSDAAQPVGVGCGLGWWMGCPPMGAFTVFAQGQGGGIHLRITDKSPSWDRERRRIGDRIGDRRLVARTHLQPDIHECR